MFRKVSFIVAFLGISFLLSLSNSFIELTDFENSKLNQKVVFSGIVKNQKVIGNFRILKIGEIEFICECVENYLGKKIKIFGFVEEYNGKRQIRVLGIKLLEF